MDFKIYLDIEEQCWEQALPDAESLINNVKDAVVGHLASICPVLSAGKDYSVNLCLSNDENIRQLNKAYRHLDKPTNVLSFANVDDETFGDMLSYEDLIELGDVIIAYETMEREAYELGISLKNHFCHLWTHGLLHILGYDHIQAADAAQMEQLEAEILDKLGISNPYEGE